MAHKITVRQGELYINRIHVPEKTLHAARHIARSAPGLTQLKTVTPLGISVFLQDIPGLLDDEAEALWEALKLSLQRHQDEFDASSDALNHMSAGFCSRI